MCTLNRAVAQNLGQKADPQPSAPSNNLIPQGIPNDLMRKNQSVIISLYLRIGCLADKKGFYFITGERLHLYAPVFVHIVFNEIESKFVA